MEHNFLLKELLDICNTRDIPVAKAYNTFEVYLELSEVRKLSNLKYHFNERLKRFYLTGRKNDSDEITEIYIPEIQDDEITPQEMNIIQESLCPLEKQFYLFVRDRDSSSTNYFVKEGLVIPESPEICQRRKELEGKKFHLDKSIQCNKKFFYSKALGIHNTAGTVSKSNSLNFVGGGWFWREPFTRMSGNS